MRRSDEGNLLMTTFSDMNEQDTFERELFELIARYEDDALDEVGLARLNEALIGSERARELFNDVCLQSLSIGEALAADVSARPDVSVTQTTRKVIAFPRWAYAAAAAIVATIATVSFFGPDTTPEKNPQEERDSLTVRLHSKKDTVEFFDAVGNPIIVDEANGLLPGTTVVTHASAGSTTLVYPDGTLLSLGPDSLVSFVDADRKLVKLDRGELRASVKKQPADKPFGVLTPHLEITVVGTEFQVSVDHEDTSVRVSEGRVKIHRVADQTETVVSAGQDVVVAAKGDLPSSSVAVASGNENTDSSTAASATDSTPSTPPVTIEVKVGPSPVKGVVTLGRSAVLRGRALDAQRQPYSKVRISIHPKNNLREIVHETLTDPDGRFEIKLRLAGEFLARIHSDIEVEVVLELGKTTDLGDLTPAGQ